MLVFAWSQPQFIRDTINTAGDFININFALDFEFSLVQEGVFTRGFYLSTSAQADFAGIAGFNFKLTAIARGSSAASLASNPLAVLENAGISIAADVNLPFGIGAASFNGLLSPSILRINSSVVFGVAGVTISSKFFLISAASGSQMAMEAKTRLGPFADVDVSGSFSNQAGLSASASVNSQILFFYMTGSFDVRLTPTEQQLRFQGAVGFCGLGSQRFRGQFSATPEGTRMFLEASTAVSLMGFSASSLMSLEYTNAKGTVFYPSLTIDMPNPFGRRTFGWVDPANVGTGRSLKAEDGRATLLKDVEECEVLLEQLENATGWSYYLTDIFEHVDNFDPDSRLYQWQELNNTLEIRNASLRAMRSHRLPIARAQSRSGGPCSPLEFSFTKAYDIGPFAFFFSFDLSTANTQMSIEASARVLALSARFSGSIWSTGFELKSRVTLADFWLGVGGEHLGTLSATVFFDAKATTDGAGMIGVGGELSLRKGSSWLVGWMGNEIKFGGSFKLIKRVGEDLKLILDFRIPGCQIPFGDGRFRVGPKDFAWRHPLGRSQIVKSVLA